MKLDDTVRNWPVAPFHMSVSWTGNKGKSLERLKHDITLISGVKRLKLMISAPHKCTSKYSHGSCDPHLHFNPIIAIIVSSQIHTPIPSET